MSPLKGKRIVLTGGAGGIGSLVAKELRNAKSEVVIVDRTAPHGDEQFFLKGDLATLEGIAAVGEAVKRLVPDILINLAGAQYFGPFERQNAEHMQMTYMVNLIAPALLSQAVLPSMRERGGGQIVNIGSVLGSINYPYFTTYSSAKAGLRGLSEALRREVSGTGICITYIAPRAVKTGMNTAEVMRFAALTKMHLDEPETVARRIVSAIRTRKKEVFFGFPERIFVSLNALVPRFVDAAVTGEIRKARTLFTP